MNLSRVYTAFVNKPHMFGLCVKMLRCSVPGDANSDTDDPKKKDKKYQFPHGSMSYIICYTSLLCCFML